MFRSTENQIQTLFKTLIHFSRWIWLRPLDEIAPFAPSPTAPRAFRFRPTHSRRVRRVASLLPLTGGPHLSAPSFSPPLKPSVAGAFSRALATSCFLDWTRRIAMALSISVALSLPLFYSLSPAISLSSPSVLRRCRFKSGRLRPPPSDRKSVV